MSNTSPVDVSKLSKLASLTLSPAQTKSLAQQFNSTIKMVDLISNLETETIKQTSQVTGLKNVYRDDVVEPDRLLTPPSSKYYIVNAIFHE